MWSVCMLEDTGSGMKDNRKVSECVIQFVCTHVPLIWMELLANAVGTNFSPLYYQDKFLLGM